MKLWEERDRNEYFLCAMQERNKIHFFIADKEGSPVPSGSLFIINEDGCLTRCWAVGEVIAKELGLRLDTRGRIMLNPLGEI